MDSSRFDALARSFSAATSRRRIGRLSVGLGVLTVIGLPEDSLAGKKKKKGKGKKGGKGKQGKAACHPMLRCGDDCCEGETWCVDGACCPVANLCEGKACCTEGNVCLAGRGRCGKGFRCPGGYHCAIGTEACIDAFSTCCPVEKACNVYCCGPDQECSDWEYSSCQQVSCCCPSTETCGPDRIECMVCDGVCCSHLQWCNNNVCVN